MGREGRRIEEFRIYLNNTSYPAILRMTDGFKFILEVDQMRLEGDSPKDLIHKAQMRLEGEADLAWTPIILVDPDLDDGRLMFSRLFQATSKEGKQVWRTWRFDGENERQKGTWSSSEVATYARVDGAEPGDHHGGPRVKDRELPYTPGRWQALVALDTMLKEALAAMAKRLHDIIRNGDVDALLEKAARRGPPAILFADPESKDAGKGAP